MECVRAGLSDRAADKRDSINKGSRGDAVSVNRDFQIEDVDGYEVADSVSDMPRILSSSLSLRERGIFRRTISNVFASYASCTTITAGFTRPSRSRNSSCFEISSSPRSSDTIVSRRIVAVQSRIVYSMPLGMSRSRAVFGWTPLDSIPPASCSAA